MEQLLGWWPKWGHLNAKFTSIPPGREALRTHRGAPQARLTADHVGPGQPGGAIAKLQAREAGAAAASGEVGDLQPQRFGLQARVEAGQPQRLSVATLFHPAQPDAVAVGGEVDATVLALAAGD